MTAIQAFVLGVIQGTTEFLPVSSDGHLGLAYHVFRTSPDLAFEVFLHFATLLAMVVYFRADIVRLARSLGRGGKGSADRRLVWLIVLATGVSAALALALKKTIEAANASLVLIGVGFLVTSGALVAAELLSKRVAAISSPDELGWPKTVAIAVAQGLAALPGVSRSGSTIAGGMLAGLSRESAARFSFLLGIPVIAAANLWEAKDIFTGEASLPALLPSAVGFVAAGLAGYLAIWGLLALVRRRSLWGFAVYTALVGVASIIASLLGLAS